MFAEVLVAVVVGWMPVDAGVKMVMSRVGEMVVAVDMVGIEDMAVIVDMVVGTIDRIAG